ncbi:MAG: condensation domain-containing protein, partial [Marinifilaceae bacterium]
MEIARLILKLDKLKIKIKLCGQELDVKAPKGVLTNELIHDIRINKEELINYLKREQKRNSYFSIPQAKEQPYYQLSSAQKRLFLLQQIELDTIAYNMPYAIPLNRKLDKRKIEEVFRQLIFRHESFRTSFKMLGDEPVQRISAHVDFKIEELIIEKSKKVEFRKNFVRGFDLSKAPLLRVALVEIKGEGNLLMIDMHHIVSDGVSHAILEREFRALYSGEALSPLKLQYRDYSEWQQG